MEHAGKAVLAALRRLAGSEQPIDFLTALWPLIVGARLAEHTRPNQWRKGELQVAVSDREWQEQLERMPDALRARINRWWGEDVVDELTFVRGQTSPQVAVKAKTKQSKAGAPKEPETHPQNGKIEELREALSRIRDPAFRDLVERMAAKYLALASKEI